MLPPATRPVPCIKPLPKHPTTTTQQKKAAPAKKPAAEPAPGEEVAESKPAAAPASRKRAAPAAAAPATKKAAAAAAAPAPKKPAAAAPKKAAAAAAAAAAAPAEEAPAKKAKAAAAPKKGKLAPGDQLPAFELETDGERRAAACERGCRTNRVIASSRLGLVHHQSKHDVERTRNARSPSPPRPRNHFAEGVTVKSSDLVAENGIVIFAYPRANTPGAILIFLYSSATQLPFYQPQPLFRVRAFPKDHKRQRNQPPTHPAGTNTPPTQQQQHQAAPSRRAASGTTTTRWWPRATRYTASRPTSPRARWVGAGVVGAPRRLRVTGGCVCMCVERKRGEGQLYLDVFLIDQTRMRIFNHPALCSTKQLRPKRLHPHEQTHPQANWRTKYELPYNLLCDPERTTLKALGIQQGDKIVRSHIVVAKGGAVVDVRYQISPGDSFTEAVATCKAG